MTSKETGALVRQHRRTRFWQQPKVWKQILLQSIQMRPKAANTLILALWDPKPRTPNLLIKLWDNKWVKFYTAKFIKQEKTYIRTATLQGQYRWGNGGREKASLSRGIAKPTSNTQTSPQTSQRQVDKFLYYLCSMRMKGGDEQALPREPLAGPSENQE